MSCDEYFNTEISGIEQKIRDIKFIPELAENDRWVIWQVSNRGRVTGIPGFTDKNVLRNGTVEDLIENSKIKPEKLEKRY